jgi:translation initiation factor 2A
MPGSVKIFLLPNTTAPVAQKNFYKADLCNLNWSPSGKHLLVMSQTDVDSTGVSYYGETNLYFLSGDGSFDCRVELDKEGPIHDFAWSPRSDEFIVLYGYMPAKAMLFDLKCNSIFEFPVGSKNHVRWNQRGSLICFGGFGNLPGHIEVWSRSGAIRRLGHCQTQGSALCEWAPDGSTLLTGVLTPRLRVDNNFKVWNWDGSMLGTTAYGELYHVLWRPTDTKLFREPDLSKVPAVASGLLNTDTVLKKEVYRPPGLRNQSLKSVSTTAPPPSSKPAPTLSQASSLTKEEKAVKKLRDKLDQIAALKDKRNSGETMELNQIEKIEKEGEIQKEYKKAIEALKATGKSNF